MPLSRVHEGPWCLEGKQKSGFCYWRGWVGVQHPEGTLDWQRDTGSHTCPAHVGWLTRSSSMGAPCPLAPTEPLRWGWGTGTRALGREPQPMSQYLLPASLLLRAVSGLLELCVPPVPIGPHLSSGLSSPGERLCSSKSGGPACPHTPRIDLPRENQ